MKTLKISFALFGFLFIASTLNAQSKEQNQVEHCTQNGGGGENCRREAWEKMQKEIKDIKDKKDKETKDNNKPKGATSFYLMNRKNSDAIESVLA